MFPRILQATQAFFQRPTPKELTSQRPTTEAQLQAELADAALEGMVTTRRQSHVVPEEDLGDGSEVETPQIHAKKRKTGNDADTIPRASLAKRRRKSSASGTIVVATPVKANGVRQSTSASKSFNSASDETLESDSHTRSGREPDVAGNRDVSSVVPGDVVNGTRNAGSKISASHSGNGMQKAHQTVAVVIENKPIDNERSGEENSSNKRISTGKEGLHIKDLRMNIAAIVDPVDHATKTSTASSSKNHEMSASKKQDNPLVEQSNGDASSPDASSPTNMAREQARIMKNSTGPPKAPHQPVGSKRVGNLLVQQLDEGKSTRASNGEEGASMMNMSASAPKATHKRFASEELDTPPVQQPNGQEPSENHNEKEEASVAVEDSDEDAPETVTASAGLNQARTTALEAARAVEKQEAMIKEKRKKGDSRLKEQAKSAIKRKNNHWEELPEGDLDDAPPATSEGPVSNQQEASIRSRLTRKDPLPPLLPDEILAIEPVARPPTPPAEPEATLVSMTKKRRFLDADPKPPKDVKRGPVNVRVLEAERQVLPPKASKPSKALKEAWLVGRRGAGGSYVVQRRKLGVGFVRR